MALLRKNANQHKMSKVELQSASGSAIVPGLLKNPRQWKCHSDRSDRASRGNVVEESVSVYHAPQNRSLRFVPPRRLVGTTVEMTISSHIRFFNSPVPTACAADFQSASSTDILSARPYLHPPTTETTKLKLSFHIGNLSAIYLI